MNSSSGLTPEFERKIRYRVVVTLRWQQLVRWQQVDDATSTSYLDFPFEQWQPTVAVARFAHELAGRTAFFWPTEPTPGAATLARVPDPNMAALVLGQCREAITEGRVPHDDGPSTITPDEAAAMVALLRIARLPDADAIATEAEEWWQNHPTGDIWQAGLDLIDHLAALGGDRDAVLDLLEKENKE